MSKRVDGLRVALLVSAFLLNLIPLYQFIGSMIWFREYLGDYKVFWGIASLPGGEAYEHQVFGYPPTALLLIKPFGLLPFWPSLLAWSAGGALAMILAARRIMPLAAIALGLATYAGIGVLVGGQISLFIGALVIAAISASQSRWRGLLLGIAAVIKPQSLLAAPIGLVAERNWRAIGWAVAASLALVAASMVLFGPQLWLRWGQELPRFQAVLEQRGLDTSDVGLYGLARSLGLPGVLYVIGIPLAGLTTWTMFRSEAKPLDRYAAFAASSVLLSPYTLYYDLAGLTLACTAMLLDRGRSPLVWLAAALVVSSVFASVGVLLLSIMLAMEALRRRDA